MAEKEIPRPNTRQMLLEQYPWLTYVLPMAVFLVVGALEPRPTAGRGIEGWWAVSYDYYPAVYALKILLTVAAIGLVLPGYRAFPVRITWPSILVGVLGIVVWVGLSELHWEHRLLSQIGLGRLIDMGVRSAYNPFEALGEYPAVMAWGFLAVRFFGLVLVVPIIEEFLLRGFLMRFVMASDWQRIPFGQVSVTAVVVGSLFPMLMHPAELLAAAAWFSLITVLMVKTRRIWDCIAAHAVTNLLLGLYVLATGHWQLL